MVGLEMNIQKCKYMLLCHHQNAGKNHTTVKDKIRRYSSHYSDRLRTHPNHLAVNLLQLPDTRCLRRFLPNDLPDRF
jgi:hypothetical protein